MSYIKSGGAYIVLESGQKFPLHSVSVTHQYDTFDVTCLDFRKRRYARRGPSRIMIEAVASGVEADPDVVKCGSCGSSDYRWNEGSGRVCAYCRTPA